MGQIAEFFLQERIFSLYCLEYSESLSAFIAPDRRLREFGDTAVIIVDPAVFLRCFADALLLEYKDSFWFGAKRVQYSVDLKKFTEYDEFTKTSSYSWQNEYRIALDLSNGQQFPLKIGVAQLLRHFGKKARKNSILKPSVHRSFRLERELLSNGQADQQAWEDMTDFSRIMYMNQGGRVDHNAKREPTIVRIGDIREACITVTTNDLIDLRLPHDRLNKIAVPPPLMPPRRPVVTTYRPVMM